MGFSTWEKSPDGKLSKKDADVKPISQIDYENVLDAESRDVQLVPIHQIEYFKNMNNFINFLFKVPILDDFSNIKKIKNRWLIISKEYYIIHLLGDDNV